MTATPENMATALAAVQADLPHVPKNRTANVPTKNGGSYSYKYADLNDVASAIHPLLAKAGLSFIALPTTTDDGRFVLRYSLRHTSGEVVEGEYPLPDPERNTPQQIGSALTYARRYVLSAVTGVVPDEDDDGQAAQAAEKPKRAQRMKRSPEDEFMAPTVEDAPPPPPPAETDKVWFEAWQEKVSGCTDLAALAQLYSEALEARRFGRLSKADFEDAVVLKDVQKAALERAQAEKQGAWSDVEVAKIPEGDAA